MEKLVFDIWLSNACTPDTATFPKLMERFENAYDVYVAREYEIRAAVGSNASDCARLLDKDLSLASKIYDFCVRCKVGLIAYDDPRYPKALKEIATPPVLLYYRGILPDFNGDFFAGVVGSRSISDYGRNNAFHLGYDLAKAGAVIVSGLAIGIDGVAMGGAIAAGGKVVGVLGSGINVCYPKEHYYFSREVVKHGCIITEFPPDTKPLKYNFPRRNRIISGLSSFVTVVEAGERSGAMITARQAKKQGRPVYAFPGNVNKESSQGTNVLIKNGAKLCTGADDIVRDYSESGKLNPHLLETSRGASLLDTIRGLKIYADTPSDRAFARPVKLPGEATMDMETTMSRNSGDGFIPYVNLGEGKPVPTRRGAPALDEDTIALYKRIPPDTDCLVEDLVDEKNDISKVNIMLLKLEMGGFVTCRPGGRVKRNIK